MNPLMILVIVFVVLLLMNMPIAFAVGISSLTAFYTMPDMMPIVAVQKVVGTTQSFTFLAVPFFLLAGSLMNISGITERLVKFARVLTGHLPGGLAQVSVVLSALMGGISGSATVDAAMEARFLGPSMIQSGYSKGFTGAVLSFGGLITATIPPSMGLIIYGSAGDVSIGKLFMAGIIPGVVLTVVLMAATHLISIRRGYLPETNVKPARKKIISCGKECFWALMFPILLILGIRSGFFTTSEAGAFAVMYSVVVGKFVYKELNFKKLFNHLDVTLVDIGNCMAIIAFCSIFSYISTVCGVPRQLAMTMAGISANKYVILFALILFLLVAGCIMDGTVNAMLFAPIFVPIVSSVGIDPVHFGIIFMTVVTLGCMTPPVGSSLFVVCRILGCSTTDYIKEGIPYVLACLVYVVILALVPGISLSLVHLLY